MGTIAALLFAAHPLATQAVTYLIQRTTSLAALFELGAVALYLQARDRQSIGPWMASWAVAVLAAFSKEMAVVLPIVIVTIEIALRRAGASRIRNALLAPYFVVVPLIAWAAQLPSDELGRAVSGLRETTDLSRTTYFLTELTVIPRYLLLWVWPVGENLDPDVVLRHAPDAAVFAGAGVLVALSAAALVLRNRLPLVALGWAWFLLCLAPESSVFPIRDVMVEHRAYLPMAGLCFAVAAWLAELVAGGIGYAVLPAALVLALTLVTHHRNLVWRSEVSLWRNVCSGSPRKARGYNNLAMALEASGNHADAESTYRRAIAVEPEYVYARVNLGRLYGIHGRYHEALVVLEDAQRLAPNQLDVLINLGNANWGLGDTTLAAAFYTRALEVAPGARLPALTLARMRGLPDPP